MKSNLYIIFFTVSLLLAAAGCSTPKDITYMQGFDDGQSVPVADAGRILVQPNDKLGIVVSSRDPALAEVFNLAISQYRIGSGIQSTAPDSRTALFNVDPWGRIDYPLLGSIHVAGLDRHQLARRIKQKIIDAGLLKDPVVVVEFMNASISVLGDVNKPGEYPIDRDDMTILQALAKAGDLQITGMRKNVLVVRQEGDRDVAYRIDLTDTGSIFNSPAYYMRQNDVIYVEPNNTRKRNSQANGNTIITPSFWLSVVSVITTVCVFFFK